MLKALAQTVRSKQSLNERTRPEGDLVHHYLVPIYSAYLVATIGLCAWLARTLFQNGAVFLADVFDERPELAQAVNRLLVTGFAMLNLGYGFFLLQGGRAADGTEAMEVLARKLGVLLVSLAVFHFVNIAVFHWINGRRRQAELAPPVAPQRHVDNFAAPAPPTAMANERNPWLGTTVANPPPPTGSW
jgi:hypothetical protein